MSIDPSLPSGQSNHTRQDGPDPQGSPRPDRSLFLVGVPICAGVALLGISNPEALNTFAAGVTQPTFNALDWFWVATVTGLIVLCGVLALGPIGQLTLGLPGDKPEFPFISWLSMLFAAGMGVGLLFWGVAEPLTHFLGAPGVDPGTPAAARHAMVLTVFHWCLHAWAVYAIAALILAYFGFRRRTPYLPGAPLRNVMTGNWVAPVSWLADLIAVIAVALGVAGSIAMGIFQMQSGLFSLAGLPSDSIWLAVGLLLLLLVCYMLPLALPLDKGIQWLSNGNMLLAVMVMLFILFAGPTGYIFRNLVTTFGDYLSNLVSLSFQLYPFQNQGSWMQAWTLNYFIWWIAWAPFVGVFIARISKGRTIREFIMGVLLVPSAFSVLWFAVFGGAGLYEELFGIGGVADLARLDASTAMFSLFDRFPFSTVLNASALFLAFVFLITSVVSAAFVLGMFTSQGSLEPPLGQKLLWGLILGGLGAAMMLSGDVQAARSISVLGALPFTLIIVLQLVAFIRALREDLASPKSQAVYSERQGERQPAMLPMLQTQQSSSVQEET